MFDFFLIFFFLGLVAASYLDDEALIWKGRFTTPSATLNNFVANFNKTFFFGPHGPIPWWNPNGLNSFEFSTTLQSGGAPLGCAAGAALRFDQGFLVDVDPDNQFVSEVFGGFFYSPLFNASLANTPAISRQWTQALAPRPNPPPIAATTAQRAAVLTLALSHVAFDPVSLACSPALAALARRQPEFLALRLSLNNFDNDNTSTTFATGDVVIALGAASDPFFVEPPRVAGVAKAGGGAAVALGPAVPFEIVNGQLRLDLGTAVPTVAPGGASALSQLRLGVLRGAAGPTWLANGAIATDAATILKSGGIARVPLTPIEATLLASRALVLADSGGNALLWERDDGAVVRAYPRVIRLRRAAAREPVIVRTWRFGQPVATSVAVKTVPSPMPQRADRVNNAPPGIVALANGTFFSTNASGTALTAAAMTRPVGVGELPDCRQPLRSQMYFLNLLVGQLLPYDDAAGRELLSVRIWTVLPPTAHGNASLVWADVAELFQPYSWLYPAMVPFADLSSQAGVAASKRMIASTMSMSILDAGFMPVTRDLDEPAQQRMVLFAKQQK